jgi:hypothetical protein
MQHPAGQGCYSIIPRLHVNMGNFTIRIDMDEKRNRIAAHLAVLIQFLAPFRHIDLGGKFGIAIRAGNVGVS